MNYNFAHSTYTQKHILYWKKLWQIKIPKFVVTNFGKRLSLSKETVADINTQKESFVYCKWFDQFNHRYFIKHKYLKKAEGALEHKGSMQYIGKSDFTHIISITCFKLVYQGVWNGNIGQKGVKNTLK